MTALFESVLVFDETGAVLQRSGLPVDISNVLLDERMQSLRSRLEDCVAGTSFEAHFSINNRERTRWRGVPYATDDGVRAAALGIEGSFGKVSRTRLAGSEFDFVLANMRQGFLRRSAKGAIAYVNKYLANQFELTPEEVMGRHIGEFMPGAKNQEGQYEAEFVTQSGVRRRAIVSTAPLVGARGRVSGYIDVVTDITADHAFRTKLVAEVQKMSHLAYTDSLTGQANRTEFQSELERLTSLDPPEPFGLVMVDLDQFKEVNDQFGHSAGDEVLVEFASRLRLAVRDSDLVARLGGDEFAILLSGAPKEIAAEFVSRLIDRLSFKMTLGDEIVQVGASVGWAHSDDGAAKIFQSADRRMYRDKRKRKGA
ncbi:MAG: sensor domain-containing diguanylate cyclase [Chlorobia bacterium]|nr:sensor domain-containing diguanylate cyclase [Fimbriimonadaceae bacterium]